MVKLMQDRLMETFADAVGLRMTLLGSGMGSVSVQGRYNRMVC